LPQTIFTILAEAQTHYVWLSYAEFPQITNKGENNGEKIIYAPK